MVNTLENLKQYSSIVADTGDIDSIKKFYTQPAYKHFHSEDAFHKKIQQFTKNKEL